MHVLLTWRSVLVEDVQRQRTCACGWHASFGIPASVWEDKTDSMHQYRERLGTTVRQFFSEMEQNDLKPCAYAFRTVP